MAIINKVKIYAQKQGFVDLCSLIFFTIGTTLIATTTALFLLKSPLYGLIGLVPLLFHRFKNFDQWTREFDKKIGANCELVSSLQIGRLPDNNREAYSRELISAFIQATETKFQNINPNEFINKKFLKWSVLFLLVSIIFFLLYPGLFPGRFWFALNHKIEYIIEPGSGKFDRGKMVEINIDILGPYIPHTAKLIYETNLVKQYKNLRVIDGRARTSIELDEPLRYHFELYNIKTPEYELAIIEPIYLKQLTFYLRYPAYTHLKDEIKTERQLIVPSGTEVEIKGTASCDLKQARLLYNDTIDFVCQGHEFSGRFKIDSSGTANLQISGESSHNEPITIYAISDLAPLVEIFYPGYNINLPPDMKLTLGIKCSDDYELNRLTLHYQFKEPVETNIKFRKGIAEDTIFYEWDIKNLKMLPGDRVSYFVEVQDNAGQKSKSKTYYMYFPTMEQIYEEVKE
ncbi:MAG: DUF4175 family protein, partial [candidate division WOR-3 bacterium]